jgi:16S rRNA (guanine527-N7)-methyltransferase
VTAQIRRCLELGSVVEEWPPRTLDLGSGGGLPGLPLAVAQPTTTWILLDGSTRRADFLAEAVKELDLGDRVQIVAQRAEDAGRGPLRGTIDLVFARSFGRPAAAAECGSPFLVVGGRMLVAEPPEAFSDRWDEDGLAQLGLALGPRLSAPSAVQLLVQDRPCPERFPRRTGVPAKRPLF